MTTHQQEGLFFALEGGDGCGKTEQNRLLKENWDKRFPGHPSVFTKEPGGGTEFSHAIRELALNHPDAGNADPGAIFGLMIASRFDHLGRFVIPHLQAGRSVISDRFEAATFAYQIVGQEASELRGMYHEHRLAVRQKMNGNKPHIIIIDVDPDTCMERLLKRKEGQGDQNHFDLRPREFHERVRDALREYRTTIDPTAVVIDGNGTPQEVHELMVAAIQKIMDAERIRADYRERIPA